MKTVVVIPTYNEATNIRAMVSDLCSLSVPDLSVLVVDDASPDGTGRIADELASESPARVRVLHRAGKSGLGTAYIAGFRSALDAGAAVIGQMDADFSHSPEYVPRLIERLADSDVVVGSRYVPGGSLDERWEYGRFLLSWFANSVYARAILGLRVRDVT
ncbi:MAG: glycosyltransferase, partial [Anaerolineales bacterium]